MTRGLSWHVFASVATRALAGPGLEDCGPGVHREENWVWWLDKGHPHPFFVGLCTTIVGAVTMSPWLPFTISQLPLPSLWKLCLCWPTLGTLFRRLLLDCGRAQVPGVHVFSGVLTARLLCLRLRSTQTCIFQSAVPQWDPTEATAIALH